MKCGLLWKCFIYLSVFVVFSQAQDTDCWVEHDHHKYTLVKETKVNGNKRCKSLCFDLNQLSKNEAGGCNVVSTYTPGYSRHQWCYMVTTVEPSKINLASNSYYRSYIMNEDCKYRSCWSRAGENNQKLDLKEVASLTEKQCKLRCMETWNCKHIAFTNNTCFIQYWNAKLNSESSKTIGTIYKVNDKCKDERCWEIFYDEDKAWTTLVNRPEATAEFNCREYCLIIWNCNVYIWKYGETDIRKRCWVMEAKAERNNHAGFKSPGVNSWVMREKCHDWNADGSYNGNYYNDFYHPFKWYIV